MGGGWMLSTFSEKREATSPSVEYPPPYLFMLSREV